MFTKNYIREIEERITKKRDFTPSTLARAPQSGLPAYLFGAPGAAHQREPTERVAVKPTYISQFFSYPSAVDLLFDLKTLSVHVEVPDIDFKPKAGPYFSTEASSGVDQSFYRDPYSLTIGFISSSRYSSNGGKLAEKSLSMYVTFGNRGHVVSSQCSYFPESDFTERVAKELAFLALKSRTKTIRKGSFLPLDPV